MNKLFIILLAVAAFALASTPAKAQDAKKTAEAVSKAHREAEKGKPAPQSTAEAATKAPKAARKKPKSKQESTAEAVAKAHRKDVK